MIRITAESLDQKGEVFSSLGHLYVWPDSEDPWVWHFSLVLADGGGHSGTLRDDGDPMPWPAAVAQAWEAIQAGQDPPTP